MNTLRCITPQVLINANLDYITKTYSVESLHTHRYWSDVIILIKLGLIMSATLYSHNTLDCSRKTFHKDKECVHCTLQKKKNILSEVFWCV